MVYTHLSGGPEQQVKLALPCYQLYMFGRFSDIGHTYRAAFVFRQVKLVADPRNQVEARQVNDLAGFFVRRSAGISSAH